MAKISRHFRLEPEVIKQLESLAKFYTNVQSLNDDRLPTLKRMTNTDVIEYLIRSEYKKLKDEHYEL